MKKLLIHFNPEYLGFILLIFCITLSRLFLYQYDTMSAYGNFTPIGALALFGGAIYSNYRSYAIPILTLWISDLFLNRFVYYGEWKLFYEHFYWTYSAFILMVLVGKYVIPKVNFKNIALSAVIITFIHWIVTDLGVWLEGTLYPKNMQGLWMCLLAAIPYELNFLAGTAIFSSILFGANKLFEQAGIISLFKKKLMTDKHNTY